MFRLIVILLLATFLYSNEYKELIGNCWIADKGMSTCKLNTKNEKIWFPQQGWTDVYLVTGVIIVEDIDTFILIEKEKK